MLQKLYETIWIIVLFGAVLAIDWMLPAYGFQAERASWAWRAIQLGVTLVTSLLMIRLLVIAGIYAHSNHPTNQIQPNPTQNQLTNQNQLDGWLDDAPQLEANQPMMPLISVENPPAGVEEEGRKLSDEVQQSVLYFAREGTYKAAGERLGKHQETIRKNVLKAKEVAPNWYKMHVKD